MAFNDLTPEAQEGLNYAANKIAEYLNADGSPKYASGRLLMDAISEEKGQKFYERKIGDRRARRAAKLEQEANAALAAQVDALPG